MKNIAPLLFAFVLALFPSFQSRAYDRDICSRGGCNVGFDSGQCGLRKESLPFLNKAADFAQDNYHFYIAGHTDNSETKDGGKKLSLCRANAVKDYLIKKGVDTSLLSVEAWGDKRPVDPKHSPEGEILSRRVEISWRSDEFYKLPSFPKLSLCSEEERENFKDSMKEKELVPRYWDTKMFKYFDYGRVRKTFPVTGEAFEAVAFDKRDGWVPYEEEYHCPRIEYWTPTSFEIHEAEKEVSACANQVKEGKVNSFKRQYIGVLKEGEKYFIINFLGYRPNEDWKKKADVSRVEDVNVVVDFSLMYNLERGQCFNLHVN